VQGFLLARPLTPHAARALLMKQSLHRATATPALAECLSS
jgi:hypothetical protein